MQSWIRIASAGFIIASVVWLVSRVPPPPMQAPARHVASPVVVTSDASPPAAEPARPLPEAPAFRLQDLQKHPVALSDFHDKKVVVASFFATWCEPCGLEAPDLESLSREYRGRPVQFLLLSTDGPGADVAGWARDHGITFPVLTGAGDIRNRYGEDGIPFLVVIDRLGRVAATHLGYSPTGRSVVARDIDAALAPPATSLQSQRRSTHA